MDRRTARQFRGGPKLRTNTHESEVPIPPILFKYQAFTPDALSNLTSRQIWFSRPARFNDPFDCAIRVDRGPIADSDYQHLYAHVMLPHVLSVLAGVVLLAASRAGMLGFDSSWQR